MSAPATLQDRQTGPAPAATTSEAAPMETRGARLRRKGRRFRMHLAAIVAVALLVCVVALALSNTGRVRLDWLLGSGSAPLVWIVILAALLGWLLGMVTGSAFRWRTRAPRSARGAR
jgi:uncharacterized integral membrane protein